MKYNYQPRGVCPRQIDFDLEDGIVKNVVYYGGCPGNHLAIAALVEGQPAEKVIETLQGIRCGNKASSCGDQLAMGLKAALKEQQGGESTPVDLPIWEK